MLVPDITVAPRRQRLRVGRAADDRRPDEHHQVRLGPRFRPRPEKLADARNVPEQWHLLDRSPLIVVQQAAQRDDLAVVDRDGGFDLALVENEVVEIGRDRPRDRADLLPQEQFDRAARIDLRLDLQLDAHILALHRAEGIVEIGAERFAGGDRYLLTNQQPRFLIIERHHRGRRQDVRLGIGFHRVDDRPENRILADLVDETAERAARAQHRVDRRLCKRIADGIIRRGRRGIAVDDGGRGVQLTRTDRPGNRQDIRRGIAIVGRGEGHAAAGQAAEQKLDA